MTAMVDEESEEVRGVSELPALAMVRPVPGFEELSGFALVEVGGDDPLPDLASIADPASVLFELVSMQRPEIRFLVAVPTAFFPDYAFDVDEPTCAMLGLSTQDDALTLVILTISELDGTTTANLLAPVVINARTRHAAQIILPGTSWPVRAPID